uniref:Predicted protein n=1 Tax=Hordeum vulgare subsp. vulgare TaxID=112509 RepID=F2EI94_HORVV|nr:predicted protein [Hordeum vulgare subsp. vulgare]
MRTVDGSSHRRCGRWRAGTAAEQCCCTRVPPLLPSLRSLSSRSKPPTLAYPQAAVVISVAESGPLPLPLLDPVGRPAPVSLRLSLPLPLPLRPPASA